MKQMLKEMRECYRALRHYLRMRRAARKVKKFEERNLKP